MTKHLVNLWIDSVPEQRRTSSGCFRHNGLSEDVSIVFKEIQHRLNLIHQLEGSAVPHNRPPFELRQLLFLNHLQNAIGVHMHGLLRQRIVCHQRITEIVLPQQYGVLHRGGIHHQIFRIIQKVMAKVNANPVQKRRDAHRIADQLSAQSAIFAYSVASFGSKSSANAVIRR